MNIGDRDLDLIADFIESMLEIRAMDDKGAYAKDLANLQLQYRWKYGISNEEWEWLMNNEDHLLRAKEGM